MNLEAFRASLSDALPPERVAIAVRALWFDAKGDWEKAHQLVQEAKSVEDAWVHAYLHRKEGDHANANYWYNRAGKHHGNLALNEEWLQIARVLLSFET